MVAYLRPFPDQGKLVAGLFDFERGRVVPFSHLEEEIFTLVREDALFFTCTEELKHVRKYPRPRDQR